MMLSGRQIHGSLPYSIRSFFQRDGLLLPMREIAREHDTCCIGRSDGKNLFFVTYVFACHETDFLFVLFFVTR